MNRFTDNEMGAFVKSRNISVTRDMSYTLAFSARPSETREIRVAVGNDSYRIPVGEQWRRYVLTFKPTQSGTTAVKFGLGRENSQVWLDSAYPLQARCGRVPARVRAWHGARQCHREQQDHLDRPRLPPDQRHTGSGEQRPGRISVTLPPFDGIVLVRDARRRVAGGSGSGKIGDLVWRDTDGDGRQDGNESGWAGLTVKLRRCNGDVIATTQTNSNGKYLFDGLGEGSYQVQFLRPAGHHVQPVPGRRQRD